MSLLFLFSPDDGPEEVVHDLDEVGGVDDKQGLEVLLVPSVQGLENKVDMYFQDGFYIYTKYWQD